MTTNGPPGPGTDRRIPSPAVSTAGAKAATSSRRPRLRASRLPPRPSSRPSRARSSGRSTASLRSSARSRRRRSRTRTARCDSWERYRALTDVLDEAIDLVDLADHKARFALVIMAALNVVLFFVAVRTDLVKDIPKFIQPFVGVYVLIYALVALYFFLQAIESLRPRKSQPQVSPVTQTGIEEFPLGIRFYEDILRRDVEDYKRAWKEVHVGQLNAELAVQAHALAGINRAKYTALRRLYSGLKLMTLLAVGLVGIAALAAVIGTARKVTKAATRGAKVLGTRTGSTTPGVKEPSGHRLLPAHRAPLRGRRRRAHRRARRQREGPEDDQDRGPDRGRDRPHAVGRAHPRLRVTVGADPLRPRQRPGEEAVASRSRLDARDDGHRSQPGVRGPGLPSGPQPARRRACST